MKAEEFTRRRRCLFREKRAQLEALLPAPLLLFWGKWEGPNIRALTLAEEFTRPTFFLCEPGGATAVFVQRIETDQLAAFAGDVEVVSYRNVAELKTSLIRRLKGYGTVLAEVSDAFFGLDRLPPAYVALLSSHVRLQSADDVLVPFRAVKTPTELALMKKAATETLKLFADFSAMVRPGAAEEDIMARAQQGALAAGGTPAFFPIVASGPRSSFPHPQRRSDKIIRAGERVIIDFGIDIVGYKADITRTFIAGGAPQEDPYYDISGKLVELLVDADLRATTPLALGQRVAAAVKSAGLADRERHGYGHGLGVETHDPHPYIIPTAMPWLERPFEDGMVFTFEPGFYDDAGGFRVEDDYVVWEGRAVRLQDFAVPE